jgi:hypothetical protein
MTILWEKNTLNKTTQSFSITEPAPGAATTDFSRGAQNQELASTSLCPVYVYIPGNHTGTL